MADSSVYVVSPPTLYLPTGGLSFGLISNDKQWQENIIGVMEKGLRNQLCFYANEEAVKDTKFWIWYWHIGPNCSMIFVDVASCSEQEVRMCLAMCKEDLPVIFHVKPGNEEFVALLKAISVPLWETGEEFDALLVSLDLCGANK